jgi:xylan 1,4-beta-xylosidase
MLKVKNPILKGFNPDPSLFHDDDGRKWLINMKWNNRIGENSFAGHLLQEYDEKTNALLDQY